MIENTLMQSNFLGRDGFKWWGGQVAPEDVQGAQINRGGWGQRVKVRILGYHPDDDIELTNEDLPWAQVLMSPESGSGKGNKNRPIRIAPGDTVLGFFLDGDTAQQPVILGVFGNTRQSQSVQTDDYQQPFSPYSGYTSKVQPDDFMIKNEVGDSSKSSQKSARHVDHDLAKKIQNARGEVERAASSAIGMKITFGDTSGSRSKITKAKGEIENAVNAVKNATPTQRLNIINGVSRKLTGLASGMTGDIINTTYADLAPKLNQGLHKLYKDVYGKVLLATQNTAIAKIAANKAQVAMVGPTKAIQNFLPCAAKNITDNMFGSVRDLLTGLLDNVENFVSCIGDQYVGALFNNIIGGINNEMSDLIGGVSKIFDGDLAGMLRSKAEGLLGIANAFNCDLPTADLGSKTNSWIIGKGPNNINLEDISNKILAVANAAQSLQEAAGSPGGVLGNLGLFDFLRPDVNTPGFSSQLGDCYTGPPLNCSGIKVNLFGGGGEGATGKAILGMIVGDTFAEQTGSLLGIQMTNGGSGYRTPPFVEIVDNCNQGYGAVARAVVDYDPKSPTYQQVIDIYVVSPGENYPIIEPVDDDNVYTVDHVVVVNSGEDYTQNDVITDDKGNIYTFFLDNNGKILNVIPPNPANTNVEPVTVTPQITIKTSTGFGAVLKAQISPRPEYQGEIKQVIDCITPRDGIVGFVNGEAYYGPFHVMRNGVKMTGAKHSDTDMIIYDTPQQSRTSTAIMSNTSNTITTVSSPVYPVSSSTQGPQGSPAPTTPSSPPASPPSSPPASPPSSPPASPPSSPPASPPSSPPSGGYGY